MTIKQIQIAVSRQATKAIVNNIAAGLAALNLRSIPSMGSYQFACDKNQLALFESLMTKGKFRKYVSKGTESRWAKFDPGNKVQVQVRYDPKYGRLEVFVDEYFDLDEENYVHPSKAPQGVKRERSEELREDRTPRSVR